MEMHCLLTPCCPCFVKRLHTFAQLSKEIMDGNHDREQATAFLRSETVRLAAQGGMKRWKLVKNESKSILATHLASFGRLELRGKEPFQVAL